MYTATREGHRGRRLGLLAILVVTTLAVTTGAGPGPATAEASRYLGMPAPEAYEAGTITTGASSIRLRGRQYVYRINTDTGTIVRKRRVDFGLRSTYSARDRLGTFSGRKYVKLTSGRYSGWWVEAREATTLAALAADGAMVRIKSGDFYALRFFADGKVRTRLAVHLSQAATFATTAQTSYNGRTFYQIAEGPFANRWVSSRKARLVSQDTTETPTSPTSTAAATWKVAVLIYRETDVTFTRSNGTDYRLQTRMSDSMYELVRDTVDRYRRSVTNWSNGLAAAALTVVDVPHPITKLDKLGSYYWVGPNATEDDLDRYAPTGKFDGVIVIWRARDSSGVEVPVGAWGWSLPPGSYSNGAGYSSIITPSYQWWWTNSPAPQEVFVHEWLHQVIYFHRDAGRLDINLHAGANYGYDNSDGTWREWYSDIMQGRVWDGSRYIGLNAEMWAAGQPTNP